MGAGASMAGGYYRVKRLSLIMGRTIRSQALQRNPDWGRRVKTAVILLNYLFEQPVIRVKKVEKVCGLSFKAANDLVSSFEKAGIIKEMTGQSRNRIFMFEPYINLFK